jgi:hypothetical protein
VNYTVYVVRDDINHRSYYGHCVGNPMHRWAGHQSSLRHGRHRNAALQLVHDKEFEGALTFEVIAKCASKQAAVRVERALASSDPKSMNVYYTKRQRASRCAS